MKADLAGPDPTPGEGRRPSRPYSLVFLDADNTLFDFDRAERVAFEGTMAALGLDPGPGAFETYLAINARLWARVEAGTLDRELLKTRRFAELFAALGEALPPGADPALAGETYLDLLSAQAFVYEGAVEVCAALRSGARLVLLTNGIARVQRRRLAASPLASAFDCVVISEEAGFAKPDPRIFAHAAALAGIDDRRSMVMVGDSLTSDVAGGAAFGIDSCWFNPGRRPLPPDSIEPTYTIASLRELPDLLGLG